MKKILLSVAIIATSFTTIAQVGVGTTDPKGALQVTSTTSGVIIPQFADLTAIQAIKKADGSTALNTDEQGMQVYNIAEKKNYMWNGTTWVAGATGTSLWENDATNTLTKLSNLSNNTTARSNGNTVMISDGGGLFIGVSPVIEDPDNKAVFASRGTHPTISTFSGETKITKYGYLTNSSYNNTSAGGEPRFTLSRARGTVDVPGAVIIGDNLGSIYWEGSDGTVSKKAALIKTVVDGANFSGSYIPSRIEFQTVDNTTTSIATIMTIKGNGKIGMGTTDPKRSLDVISRPGSAQTLTLGGSDYVFGTSGTSLSFATGTVTGDSYYSLQVRKGGESSTSNLILQSSGGNIGIASTSAAVKLDVNGYIKVGSSDSTGDAIPVVGMIRFNTTTSTFEGCTAVVTGVATWTPLH